MNTSIRTAIRTTWVATRAMVLLTLALGVVYTVAITGFGQAFFPKQANGSLVVNSSGQVVGSALLGQPFTDADGNPLPEYFQPRPSAAGDGYDGGVSSGSNYGPENPDLIEAVTQRKSQIAAFNGVSEDEVPPDAVTASSSGLDPHISPAYAEIQVNRVAQARGMSTDEVRQLVAAHTESPALGYLGQSRVNVLELNLALANTD